MPPYLLCYYHGSKIQNYDVDDKNYPSPPPTDPNENKDKYTSKLEFSLFRCLLERNRELS